MLNFLAKLNKNKNKSKNLIVSPQTGRVVSVLEIPDELFSDKILGDGAAVIPTEDTIVSPVNGEILQIAETGHAFCIRSDDGLDILMHVGVDTIGLKGKGFKSYVSVGQKVKAGEPIGEADIKLIEQSGYPTHTAILITNMHEICEMNLIVGEVEAGKTPIISYKKANNKKSLNKGSVI